MFKNLSDFSFKRTGLQAFGFLIVYLLLAMLIGAVFAVLLVFVFQLPLNNQADAVAVIKRLLSYVCIAAGIYVAIINTMVAYSKKCLNKVGSIFLILLSFIITVFFGAFLGLIPSAIMTTKDVCQEEQPD